MYKKADIVFMPYNYVIDPGMRDVLGDRLKDAVVLLDEAHNIGEYIFGYFWLFLVIFGNLHMGNWYDVVFFSFYRERVLRRREFRPPRRASGAGDQRGARGVRGGEHGGGAEWR
jgi:Rad3-related DNA helicase